MPQLWGKLVFCIAASTAGGVSMTTAASLRETTTVSAGATQRTTITLRKCVLGNVGETTQHGTKRSHR